MKESIGNIFKTNIGLIGDMDKAVYYFREQQYDKALYLVSNSIDPINTTIEAIITDREYFNLVSVESIMEMLKSILDAKKNMDFILLTDLLELQLINFLIGVQELIISKEEIVYNEESYYDNIRLLLERGSGFQEDFLDPINTNQLLESGYRVEFTSCGQMTLAADNNGTKFYFHTNSRVASEAFLLARHWLQEDKKRYILYGFGMGYHIKELLALAKEAEIEIYEADRNVIQLACAFTEVKDLLLNERIKLIFDPELKYLNDRIETMESDESLIVHYPSYKNIRCDEGIKQLNARPVWMDAVKACC